MKRYVLYHDDADGFCAAWCAWQALGDGAEYLPVQYGQAFPDIPTIGAEVFILDFSYDRVTLDLLHDAARSLVVLDHHKTAEKALAGRPYAHYNNEHSGAWLAWWWFNGGSSGLGQELFEEGPQRPPWLVLYVQDRDLWRFELEESKTINAWVGALPNTFDDWEDAACVLEDEAPHFVTATREGAAIQRWQWKAARQQAAQAKECLFGLDGFPCVPERVLVTNATLLISEIGQELCRGRPFSVTWFDRGDGTRVVSLRSDAEGMDVSEIAKSYGGGGHQHAAGFEVAPCDPAPWKRAA